MSDYPNYELIKRLRSKFLQTGFISLLNGEGVDLINHLYEHYHETRNLAARVQELEAENAKLFGFASRIKEDNGLLDTGDCKCEKCGCNLSLTVNGKCPICPDSKARDKEVCDHCGKEDCHWLMHG